MDQIYSSSNLTIVAERCTSADDLLRGVNTRHCYKQVVQSMSSDVFLVAKRSVAEILKDTIYLKELGHTYLTFPFAIQMH